ncbi:hypothetical protein [Pseudaestuariivita sp.]|uniref:hypothetical protein n=1 Tax=Pseudaestuariivita sp. TaxID=2211669 RepID=UPI004058A200
MDVPFIVPILALITILGFLIFALKGKSDVAARKDDASAPKSTLAKDKSSSGTPADV